MILAAGLAVCSTTGDGGNGESPTTETEATPSMTRPTTGITTRTTTRTTATTTTDRTAACLDGGTVEDRQVLETILDELANENTWRLCGVLVDGVDTDLARQFLDDLEARVVLDSGDEPAVVGVNPVEKPGIV